MTFFHVRTKRFDPLLRLQILAAITLAVAEIIPITRAFMFTFFNSQGLLVMYSILGTIFTWYLFSKKGWHYPQAISIAFLVVFIGSFFWEIPYTIRNAFLIGFEWDWFLHIAFVFPVWYIKNTVGWNDNSSFLLCAIGLGITISLIYMAINPIDPGRMDAAVWDGWYYLSNRVICTTLIFLMIKKSPVPYKEEIENKS